MASSPKDKFDAAVKVIRGLPKNGPFQPSHELLLKFYSYFKQATEGPCRAPKPSFWDVVNKKKWEAWSGLKDMPREKAMIFYVDELKKVSNHVRKTHYPPQCASSEIVETMPQTEEVTCFLQRLDTFYEMVEDQENHNIKGTQPNGNLSNQLEYGNGHNGEGSQDDLNYSENVTMLLKQDMIQARELNGIVTPCSQRGIKEELTGSNGYGHQNGRENGLGDEEDDEDDEDPDDEDVEEADKSDFVPIIPKREIASPTSSERPKVNGNNQPWSDSETEYEEFCDTSDDVLEQTTPFSHRPLLDFSPPAQSSLSSTPIAMSHRRLCHYTANSLPNQSQSRGNSDSLLVNLSENAGKPSSFVVNEHLRDENDSSHANPKGLIHCRGGDEVGDRERRKRAHNSRGASHNGGQQDGANSGSGGQGGDSGSSSSRGFPRGSGGGGDGRSPRSRDGSSSDLNEQIVVTLLRLQRDMSGVLNRLNSLEALVKEGKMEREQQSVEKKKQTWWPLKDLSLNSVAVILIWPLIVHIVLTYLSRRRRRFTR